MKHYVIGPTASAAPVVCDLRRAGVGDANVTRVFAAGDLVNVPAGPITFHLTEGFAELRELPWIAPRVLYRLGQPDSHLEVHR